MRVGIITFHWAANHGAVLQSYSLSTYLKQEYHAEVEIINYYPRTLELSLINALKQVKPKVVARKIKELYKEKQIKSFRNKLPLTQRYYTNDELLSSNMNYDILITGSDQIWNPYFLMHGENKITAAYYLNFSDNRSKKLAISASFGCNTLPKECREIVIPLLNQFYNISVREDTGAEILASLGIEKKLVTADPTVLMPREKYLDLCSKSNNIKIGSISKFILRNQSADNRKLIRDICKSFSKDKVNDIECLSIPDWLAAIRDSGLIVTNSYHCVIMCLMLHTPFAVVLENGKMSGMNDRFITLLNYFHLNERIISNTQEIDKLSIDIDFLNVDRVMERYSETIKRFLKRNIS